MSKKADLFGCDQCNALYQALLDCSADYMKSHNKVWVADLDRYDVYKYLSNTARTSLVAELALKLQENGFRIVENTLECK